MSISQSNIVKLSLVAAAIGLLAGCVVVPYSGTQVNGQMVYPSSNQPYYAPYYSPFYSPWYDPFPYNQDYPRNNAPAAQVRPVDNGPIMIDRNVPGRVGPDRGEDYLPPAQVRPVR